MHFLFQPYGTAGDIYPYVGIGVELKKRGHRVTFNTHTAFASLIARMGLEFDDLNDFERHQATMYHPDNWNPNLGIDRGTEFLVQDGMPKQYASAERHFVPGQTVAIVNHMSYGARVFALKHDLPLIHAHVSPFYLPSVSRPAAQPIFDWVRKALVFRFLRAAMARYIEFFILDRKMPGPQINALCAEKGIAPIKNCLRTWIKSHTYAMGLFPRFMAEPVPDDWPPMVFTGFPFFDEPDAAVPNDVREFLDAGDPPIAFTPGSATTHLRDHFVAAAEACRRLNRRGLFMTRFAEQLPADLPATIKHVPFAPHGMVLPRCCAVVSHGGIGTISQGLRAGIPQVIMPMSFDQPENARRLTEMNVARTLKPRRFTGPNLAHHLDELLNSPEVREQCRIRAAELNSYDPVQAACDQIETFARTANPHAG